MMSTEPEILPEPFSNPCASYSGNPENFIDEVVNGCQGTLYNNTGYYSKNSSSHHSLILEDPVLRHTKDSRGSYSRQSEFQNCIKLIVKDTCEDFPDSDQVGCHQNEEMDLSRTVILNHDLLVPPLCGRPSSLSSCSSNTETCPTPTPSYSDLVPSSSIEYPGAEQEEFDVRGVEVARLEEDPDAGKCKGHLTVGDESGYHPKLAAVEKPREEHVEPDHFVDQDQRLNVADSHIRSKDDIPPVMSNRRSYLSHLKLMQYPHSLLLPTTELRKLSDPAIHLRKQKLKISCELNRQRCLSDSEAPSLPLLMDEDELKSEEGYSSALGCESDRISRFQDSAYYSSPRVSLYSSDLHSQEESNEVTATSARLRRITPHPQAEAFADSSQSDDQGSVPTSNPGTMVHPRERSRRSLLKHFSQGSLGGVSVGGGSVGGASSIGASSESPSLSSLLETQSNLTATDLLSSLGFDDFDSPQLVPDRFIPKDLEFLRPSQMKAAFIEQVLLAESPDSLTSGHSSNLAPIQQRNAEISDLPLGATAENFMPLLPSTISGTAVSLSVVDQPILLESPADTVPLFANNAAIPGYSRHRILETVPEETASDLSLSPRWLSPRVSVDHSVQLDLAEGKLGASLQKPRRRSLPTREGYRLSIGSLVESDTGDSIHLSVTSYDDEIAAEREREREGLMPGICDDITLGVGRRRRRGVYTPPQTLLSWLSTQKTIDEDPDELPWPFNEEARLRKSLTEISLAQQNTLTEEDSVQDDSTLPPDDDLHLPEGGSQLELSLSPLSSSPTVPLSPQPSLSEVDIELNDLEVESWLSPEHRHDNMISHDSEGRLSPDIAEHCIDGDVRGSVPQTEAAVSSLSPVSRPNAGARPRRAPISPLNAYRSSLPHLMGEGFKSPVDHVRLPVADEVRLPVLALGLKTPNSGASRPPTSGLKPPSPLVNASPSPLTSPGVRELSSSDNPTFTAQIDSCQEECHKSVSDEMKQTKELQENTTVHAEHPCTEPSPTTGNTRRPRLNTLKQTSLESFSMENLPEDMSEIELLTGDLHSPVLSSRRSRVPFKRQENLEEIPRPEVSQSRPLSQSRSSRRGGVIEAPVASELFANTSLSKNESEVEKFMVL